MSKAKEQPSSIASRMGNCGDNENVQTTLTEMVNSLSSGSVDLDMVLDAAGTHAKAGNMLAADEFKNNRRACRQTHKELAATLEAILVGGNAPTELVDVRDRYKLNRLEMRILATVAAGYLGLGPKCANALELQVMISTCNREKLAILKRVMPDSKLAKHCLIEVRYRSGAANTDIAVSEHFIASLMRKNVKFENRWDVATQEELIDRMRILRPIFRKCDEGVDEYTRLSKHRNAAAWERQRLVMTFLHSIRPEWPLSALLKLRCSDLVIVLALLCRSIDASPNQSGALTGLEIARMAADSVEDIRYIVLSHLMPDSVLLRRKIVRMLESGADASQALDENSVRMASFDLTDSFLDKVQVKRLRTGSGDGRPPKFSMSRLVLDEETLAAIQDAIAQVSNRDLLFNEWDLKSSISYGSAVTMLFSGPPGVGKTACAEAIAHELGKNILVADYSAIQNMFVGQTEKNIVQTFQRARDSDAVLFWDEADTMFMDRNNADRNWEIREVNVLLQELEKFAGVCILATNRVDALDKALERRITLKIKFKAPTGQQIRRIWEAMLPAKMPLAGDVDLDELAKTPLTGGEIKNVILAAARRAANRPGKTRKAKMVCQRDFIDAIGMEKNGALSGNDAKGMIGFRRSVSG